MSTAAIRVGVVGCGEITQVMHLRFLTELPELEVAALCDLSESVLSALGARYKVDQLHTSYEDMLRRTPLDAVLVATPEHTGPSLAAIDAGKHLLLEKPVALDLDDAAAIAEASERSDRVAMLGYMRVYDPGYELLRERVQAMPSLRLVRSHNFEGNFARHERLFHLSRPDPQEHLGGQLAGVIDAATRQSLERAVGPDEDTQRLYWSLLMSATHDLSMLRDLLGAPRDIVHARVEDRRLVADLAFGGVLCSIEWDMSGAYEWWDQELAVFGEDEVCGATFADPYIPYVATQVTLRRADGGVPALTSVQVANESQYRREWLHFASCVRDGRPPRTTIPDGVRDIELLRDLVRAASAR